MKFKINTENLPEEIDAEDIRHASEKVLENIDIQELNDCVLCEAEIIGYGNNAEPLAEGRCCDECDAKVILERIKRAKGKK